jgi:hypothetical protein
MGYSPVSPVMRKPQASQKRRPDSFALGALQSNLIPTCVTQNMGEQSPADAFSLTVRRNVQRLDLALLGIVSEDRDADSLLVLTSQNDRAAFTTKSLVLLHEAECVDLSELLGRNETGVALLPTLHVYRRNCEKLTRLSRSYL